jgi:hypothetical protein
MDKYIPTYILFLVNLYIIIIHRKPPDPIQTDMSMHTNVYTVHGFGNRLIARMPFEVFQNRKLYEI